MFVPADFITSFLIFYDFYPFRGAQLLSGRVLSLEIDGLLVRDSPEALCFLEPDTVFILCLVLVKPRKCPNMTEKLLTGLKASTQKFSHVYLRRHLKYKFSSIRLKTYTCLT